MKKAIKTQGFCMTRKTIVAVFIGSISGAVMAWDVPSNLGEDDDVLTWESNAPSYNIYEDGNYIATVHGINRYEPIFANSAYQVVAHDFGQEFSDASTPFIYLDDNEEEEEEEEEDNGDEDEDENEDTQEFDEAELYFELNNTDGDLGIHSVVDGDAWTNLIYEDLNGRVLIEVQLSGAMAMQGLTEFFFESAEPTFDEVSPAEFFSRFPGGIYDFEGTTIDGMNIEAEATLSQVIPAPAVIYIGANPMNAFEGCADDPESDPFALLELGGGLRVNWDPVSSHHPTIGISGDIEVELYQFVYEGEDSKLTVDLDSEITEFIIPNELVESGDFGKMEVIVRDSTHNQVGTEACFQVQ